MPWKCPQCDGETDLGFNICWTCRAPRPGTQPGSEFPTNDLLVSTTPSLHTHNIDRYVGPVFGETIYGANMMRDFLAALTDITGGRSHQYESVLARGRSTAIAEMARQAKSLGGNAIVGMQMDYSSLGNSMLMICCSGTAVFATPKQSVDEPTQSSTP
ncbi:YbjQ family protein [Rhodopirellula sp. SWK7]|uniref:YbjQ family protein n=1 Tax=Rhodopirellula sp. SWK7 TaxID=595460 RepID=UPI0005C4E66E